MVSPNNMQNILSPSTINSYISKDLKFYAEFDFDNYGKSKKEIKDQEEQQVIGM